MGAPARAATFHGSTPALAMLAAVAVGVFAEDAQTKAKAGDDAAYIQQVMSLQPLGQQSNEAGSKLGAAACAE